MSGFEGGTTQREQILNLLKSRKGEDVPLYEIAPLATQYGARIMELRRAGYEIVNTRKRVGKQLHTWFRLVREPSNQVKPPDGKAQQTGWEFGAGSAIAL